MATMRSPAAFHPDGAIVIMTVNLAGGDLEVNIIPIYKHEPIPTQDLQAASGDIGEDNQPAPDGQDDLSTVAETLVDNFISETLKSHDAKSPHDDDPAIKVPATASAPSTPSDTDQVITETEPPSSAPVVDVSSEPRRHRQDLQRIVAFWAMGLVSIVIVTTTVRWAITPTIDVGPFLRSGIEAPAIMAVAALLAWLFGSKLGPITKN